MPLIQKTVTICKCLKCHHEWQPRQPLDEVKMCPNCRSIHWNEPKVPAWKKRQINANEILSATNREG